MRPDSSHYIVTSWWPLHDLTNLTVSGTDTQRIFKMRKSEYLSEMENIEVRWTMFFAGDVAYITTPSNHGPLSMGPWVIVRRLWRWIGSHNRTRAIARYPWLNGISKREFPQKLNLRHYNELALQKKSTKGVILYSILSPKSRFIESFWFFRFYSYWIQYKSHKRDR